MDTINHILDKRSLRSTKSSSVRNIVCTIISFGVLSVNTSNLHVVFVSDLVEEIFSLAQFRKLDVDGSSQGSTEISWARSNIPKVIVM